MNIEEVFTPKVAALANIATLVMALGTIVWGASAINSSVQELESFRDRAVIVHEELEAEQQEQARDIIHLEAVQDDIIREVNRLRGSEDDLPYRSRDSTRSSNRSPDRRGSSLSSQPPQERDEKEDRGTPEGSRAAVRDEKGSTRRPRRH